MKQQITNVPPNLIRVVQGGVHVGEVPTTGLGSYPIIDGKLNDFCWQGASRISGFNSFDNRRDVEQQTVAYLLYNTVQKKLYIGFKCYNSRMDKLKRIGGYRGDGCYVDREALYVSLAIGNPPRALSSCWYSQYSFEKDYWMEEREVSFSELGIPIPKQEDVFRLSLFRENGVFNENSQWSGDLVFGGFSDPACEILTFGDLSMGENMGEFKVINNSGLPIILEVKVDLFPLSGPPEYAGDFGPHCWARARELARLSLSGEPYSFSTQIKLKAKEIKKSKVDYIIKEEGDHYLTFTFYNPEVKKIYYRTGFIFTVTPNKRKLANLKVQLTELKSLVSVSSQRVRKGLEDESNVIEKKLRKLNQEVTKTSAKGSWQLLTEEVEKLANRIGKFEHKIKSYETYKNEWGELEYGLAVATNLVKLRRDKPFPGEITDTIKISACGNEYEGFQVVILPFEKDLKDIKVKITDLVNDEKGTMISAENIETHAVGYVITKNPPYETEYVGWWPDPLVPLESPYFSDIKANQLLQPLWITVYVPPDTPGGKYRGEVIVSPSNSHSMKVKFLVNVWDFNLPKETHIKTFFRFTDKDWSASATGSELDIFHKFYNKKFTPELYREWCAFQLKYRIGQPNVGIRYVSKIPGSDGRYDYSVVDKNLEFCIERGLNVFDILGMFHLRGQLSPEGLEETVAFLIDYSKHLKKKGWFDMAVVEPYNECTLEAFPRAKQYMKAIKKAIPDLKILQKGGGERFSYWTEGAKKAGTLDLVDIWCPGDVPPASWDVAIKKRHIAGDECWAYHNYSDSRIDRPAVNLRKIFWRGWARDLDGFAFWATMEWAYNLREGEKVEAKWPNRPWQAMSHPAGNGDGQLLYPGPEGHPLGSIRLEIIRDSIEDYEYLYLLRKLTQKLRKTKGKKYQDLINKSKQLLDVDRSLAEPVSPDKIYQLREQIALQIEKIKNIL